MIKKQKGAPLNPVLPPDKTPDLIPPPAVVKEIIHAKHVFSQEELLEISRDLGRTCTSIASLESQKSAVTKDFASRIETDEIKRDSLVGKVTSGYEMRPTECVIMFDPKNHSKDYMRITPDGIVGEFVERREMTKADWQLQFPAINETESPTTVELSSGGVTTGPMSVEKFSQIAKGGFAKKGAKKI